MKRFICLLCLALSAGSAQAVTVSEGAIGEFSSDPLAPHVVSAGTTQITGSGTVNEYDIFRIDGLASGAQDITFLFSSSASATNSYAAGGTILYDTTPFTGPWSGTVLGSFGAFGVGGTGTQTLSLDALFSGPLYLGLNFTYGADLSYQITLPTTNSVPLPAGGLLLLTGVACAAGLSRRMKRTA